MLVGIDGHSVPGWFECTTSRVDLHGMYVPLPSAVCSLPPPVTTHNIW
jgi:hypothetical protein